MWQWRFTCRPTSWECFQGLEKTALNWSLLVCRCPVGPFGQKQKTFPVHLSKAALSWQQNSFPQFCWQIKHPDTDFGLCDKHYSSGNLATASVLVSSQQGHTFTRCIFPRCLQQLLPQHIHENSAFCLTSFLVSKLVHYECISEVTDHNIITLQRQIHTDKRFFSMMSL